MNISTERVHQFLEGILSLNSAGELKEEYTLGIPITANHLPHLRMQRRGFEAKLDFVIQEELLFWVYIPPPRRLLIRRWNIFERILNFLKISPAVPTGDPQIDDEFFMQYVPSEEVSAFLVPGVRVLIKQLAPFEELEFTDKAFRCLKGVDISEAYTPEKALQDLDLLIDIANSLRSPAPPVDPI